MKKTLSIILSFMMMLSLTLTGCAAENEMTTVQENTEIILQIGNPLMAVNGTEKEIDNEGTTPLIQNGRTLLPVRAIIEEIGGSVAWNGEKKRLR